MSLPLHLIEYFNSIMKINLRTLEIQSTPLKIVVIQSSMSILLLLSFFGSLSLI